MDFVASLALIAPEIVLSLSGLVLLLVAAWAGDAANGAAAARSASDATRVRA